MRNRLILLLVITGSTLLSGCSSSSERHERVDYVRAKQAVKGLDVPPDLTQPSRNEAMALPDVATSVRGETLTGEQAGLQATVKVAGEEVLPQQQNLRIVRDGSMRWLESDLSAEQLWPKLREFWTQEGLALKRDEPQIGIMETEWAENRADVPEGFIRGLISKAIPSAYSAPTRDKFRIRVEPLEQGSALFLTHYGVEQANVEAGDLAQTVWKSRPSDIELTNEILNRLLVSLGVPKERGKAMVEEEGEQIVVAPRARLLERDGGPDAVLVDENFAPAWRRVGIVLDRIGLVIEDRNRSAGIYYVALGDSAEEAKGGKGWFSSLFSSDEGEPVEPRFRIILTAPSDEQTEVTLKRVDGGELAQERKERLLRRLRDGLI